MKTKYVFALGALVTCLLIGSAAQAEPFQGSSENRAIDNRTVPNGNDVPVITLPSGAVVSPGGELISPQSATKLVPVTTDKEPVTFPYVFCLSATAIGGLGALVWRRKRKNERRKKTMTRRISQSELEMAMYRLYGERGR
jgi:hypothetical protein